MVVIGIAFPIFHKNNVFRVSCVKMVVGQKVTTSIEFPPLDEEGQLELIPETTKVVQRKKLRGRVIPEYLIRWKNLPEEDVT